MVAGMPALLVWERIVFPTESSVRLDNVPAADLAGYSGLEDKVNFHEWRLLKGIAHLGASGAWGKRQVTKMVTVGPSEAPTGGKQLS